MFALVSIDYSVGQLPTIFKDFSFLYCYSISVLLQNRAVRIITNSPFDSPSKLLLSNLRLKSIREWIDYEVAVMTYKSLNDIARSYLKNPFTRNSQCSSRALRNTQSDLKLLLKRRVVGKMDFHLGERKLRTAHRLLQKRRHL